MKLTLLHKGLLLVCIPLCFEISIFGLLIDLQDRIEREAQRIDRNNRIEDSVHTILQDGVAVLNALQLHSYSTFGSSVDRKAITESFADIRRKFKELKLLAYDDPSLLQHIEDCQSGLELVAGDIKEMRQRARDSDFSSLPELVKGIGDKIQMHLNMTFRRGLLGLAGASYQSTEDLPSKQMRDQIQLVLKCGLVLSALFYIVGALLFSKHLVGRLNCLGENARRLAAGEALLSSVGGADEVAELDGNFHAAAELIEAAKRMRHRATAMITRDLKKPLQVIINCLGVLETGACGELNSKGLTSLARTQLSAEHMFGLINSVLQLEQLRTGKIQLQSKSFPLVPLLNSCIDSVKPLADEKSIVVSSSFDDVNSITVVGDAFWLEQVFVNILSNAIKFSPNNSQVSIAIQAHDGNLFVRITDQGPGIAEADIKLIFVRFHRLKATTSIAGTGLGLPIAKELIELHRGSIDVESEVGKGSTFVIKLPQSEASPAITSPEKSTNATIKDTLPVPRLGDDVNEISQQPETPIVEKHSDRARGLTLFKKGLLLVSIPLCFELSIFGVLFHFQDQIEKEAQRVASMKKFNEAEDRIIRDGIAIGAGMRNRFWRDFVSGSDMDKYIIEIQQNFALMKQLVAPDSTSWKNIDVGEKSFNVTSKSLLVLRKSLYEDSKKDAIKTKVKVELLLSEDLTRAALKVTKIGRGNVDDLESNKLRAQARVLLRLSLAFSVLLAIFGAWMYSKHIVGRISLLSQNTHRLGMGEPLAAPIGGSDEIAELDRNFHYAAELIEEAKKMRHEVTAMITHDLKTPLQVVRSYLEMLEHGFFGQLSEQGPILIAKADAECESLVKLIESVLDVEKGRVQNAQSGVESVKPQAGT